MPNLIWHPEKNMVNTKQYTVYILASKRNGTIYVGSSSSLIQRVSQHKQGLVDGFTKKYKVNKLVHYELAESAFSMVQREQQLKAWKRKWKINLIEKDNPKWKDLYYDLIGKLDPELDSG